MLHDRAHRSASSATVCALGGRSSQGTLAALRKRHLARCRWFGGHPRRRRTCRGRAPMPPLRMRVPCRPGAAPRHQPLPPSAAYTHRTAPAGHHAVRACDVKHASLWLRVRRLLQPAALRSGWNARKKTNAYGHESGHVAVEWNRPPACPPLGALDGSGLSTSWGCQSLNEPRCVSPPVFNGVLDGMENDVRFLSLWRGKRRAAKATRMFLSEERGPRSALPRQWPR